MKNCKRCGAWRPPLDFGYVVYLRGQYGERLYWRNECLVCERKRHTKRAAERRDGFDKEQQKLAAERLRRARGIAPRAFTGETDRLAQSRASKARKRRAAGVPERGAYGPRRKDKDS